MSLLPFDSNTYYQLQSFSSDYQFGFWYTDIGPLPIITSATNPAWHFTNYPTTDTTYLIRPQDEPDLCLSTDSSDQTVLVECSPDTQWRPVYDADQGGYTFGRETTTRRLGLYLASPEESDAVSGARLLTNDNQANIENFWGIRSVGSVNDNAFSTLPFEAAGAATTVAAAATSTTTSADMTVVTQDSVPSEPTSNSVPDGASANEFFAPRVNEPLDGLVASALLPENVEVICRLCRATGDLDIRPSSDDVTDLLDNGRIEIALSNFASRIDLEIQLQPGFTAVDAFFPIAEINARQNITEDEDVNLVLAYSIGIPLRITLQSTVTVRGGFDLSIPNLVLNIDPGTPENSDVSGFDSVSFSALDFSVSAPDLAFTVGTGLEMRATASIEYDGAVDVTGAINLNVGMPAIDFRVQSLNNVNADCASGGQFNPALLVTLESVALTFGATGAIELSPGPDWQAPIFGTPRYDLPRNLFPPQCLVGDRLESALSALASSPGGRGGGGSGSSRAREHAGWSILALVGVAAGFGVGL